VLSMMLVRPWSRAKRATPSRSATSSRGLVRAST
jgi:hypothetical protein